MGGQKNQHGILFMKSTKRGLYLELVKTVSVFSYQEVPIKY